MGNRLKKMLPLLLTAAIVGTAVSLVFITFGDRDEAAEATTVYVASPGALGPDSFAPTFATGQLDQATITELRSAQEAGESEGLYVVPSGTYGGPGKNICDVEGMKEFFRRNPAKAVAWAGVQGIDPGQIDAYLDSLNPAFLAQDVQLTMYGFRGGQAYGYQAVLQAGTAVLVDDQGIPRARCACGNPLVPGDTPEGTPTTLTQQEDPTTTTEPPATTTTVPELPCPPDAYTREDDGAVFIDGNGTRWVHEVDFSVNPPSGFDSYWTDGQGNYYRYASDIPGYQEECDPCPPGSRTYEYDGDGRPYTPDDSSLRDEVEPVDLSEEYPGEFNPGSLDDGEVTQWTPTDDYCLPPCPPLDPVTGDTYGDRWVHQDGAWVDVTNPGTPPIGDSRQLPGYTDDCLPCPPDPGGGDGDVATRTRLVGGDVQYWDFLEQAWRADDGRLSPELPELQELRERGSTMLIPTLAPLSEIYNSTENPVDPCAPCPFHEYMSALSTSIIDSNGWSWYYDPVRELWVSGSVTSAEVPESLAGYIQSFIDAYNPNSECPYYPECPPHSAQNFSQYVIDANGDLFVFTTTQGVSYWLSSEGYARYSVNDFPECNPCPVDNGGLTYAYTDENNMRWVRGFGDKWYPGDGSGPVRDLWQIPGFIEHCGLFECPPDDPAPGTVYISPDGVAWMYVGTPDNPSLWTTDRFDYVRGADSLPGCADETDAERAVVEATIVCGYLDQIGKHFMWVDVVGRVSQVIGVWDDIPTLSGAQGGYNRLDNTWVRIFEDGQRPSGIVNVRISTSLGNVEYNHDVGDCFAEYPTETGLAFGLAIDSVCGLNPVSGVFELRLSFESRGLPFREIRSVTTNVDGSEWTKLYGGAAFVKYYDEPPRASFYVTVHSFDNGFTELLVDASGECDETVPAGWLPLNIRATCIDQQDSYAFLVQLAGDAVSEVTRISDNLNNAGRDNYAPVDDFWNTWLRPLGSRAPDASRPVTIFVETSTGEVHQAIIDSEELESCSTPLEVYPHFGFSPSSMDCQALVDESTGQPFWRVRVGFQQWSSDTVGPSNAISRVTGIPAPGPIFHRLDSTRLNWVGDYVLHPDGLSTPYLSVRLFDGRVTEFEMTADCPQVVSGQAVLEENQQPLTYEDPSTTTAPGGTVSIDTTTTTAPPIAVPDTTVPAATTTTTTTTTTTIARSAPRITVRQLECVDTGEQTFTTVTIVVDVSENDGDEVALTGSAVVFGTEQLVPYSGDRISGNTVYVTGNGTARFTLELTNDNYDSVIPVTVTASDRDGSTSDEMTFRTYPCGEQVNSDPVLLVMTRNCQLNLTDGSTTLTVTAFVYDEDGDNLTVSATRTPTGASPTTMTPVYLYDGSMGSTSVTVTNSSSGDSEIQFRTTFAGGSNDFTSRVTVSDGTSSVSDTLSGC